jgi:hypothetical protein
MISYILSFISGLLVKTVDLSEEHGLKISNFYKYLFAISYGALLAFVMDIVFLPEFFLGILIGVLISGKIDALSHKIALISFIIFFMLISPIISQYTIVILSAGFCIIEEKVNDFIDKKKLKGAFYRILGMRPIMEIFAIALAIFYSRIEIFLLLLSFDLGYLSAKKIFTKTK